MSIRYNRKIVFLPSCPRISFQVLEYDVLYELTSHCRDQMLLPYLFRYRFEATIPNGFGDVHNLRRLHIFFISNN
jgi:hypothetical protein